MHRLTACFGWLCLAACASSTSEPVDAGQAFMPLETGRFMIYDVTEQRYSLTGPPAQSTYQLKETIGSRYTDATGQPAYRLQRFRRPTAQAPWTPDSLWTARLTDRAAIRTENGLDFVKLQFPVQERDRWDGNQFNRLGEDLYQARQVRQAFALGSQLFAETVQVVQEDDSTLISRDKRVEVYARQLGLIYKELTRLAYCSSGTCVGKAQIDYGLRQTVRLASYGKE